MPRWVAAGVDLGDHFALALDFCGVRIALRSDAGKLRLSPSSGVRQFDGCGL
jgi:hypothetical protein